MADTLAETRRFVVTVDDPGGVIQDIAPLRRTLEFFTGEDVRATFFAVPRGSDGWRIDLQQEWLEVAHGAERQGHDFQLHGLDHAHCEFGPYPAYIRALGGRDPDAALREVEKQFAHTWVRETFAAKLRTAIELFQNAFGRTPRVLRTGALSQTPDLYEAAADVGLRYVSNRVVDPRGWAYIIGNYAQPGDWDEGVPPAPYRLTARVIDLPMSSEYAWKMTAEKVEPHLALALEDLDRIYSAGGIFLLICHVQEVGADAPYSRDVLQRLLDAARQRHQVTFMTASELIDEIELGKIHVLPHPDRKTTGGYYDGN